jgi:Zn-dependent oligopeptidase
MAQENWAMARAVLQSYGKHHKTGASVPDALVDAKEKSSTFFATREMLVVIQNALRDLEFHKRAPQNYGSNKAVEQAAALQSPVADHIRPYPLTRFGHLFSSPVGGYAAGYYGYFWANLQSAAVFDHFSTKGLYDPATSSRLKTFYQEGARRDPNRIFEAFNGGPANADALLRVAGITPGKKPDAGPKGPASPAP